MAGIIEMNNVDFSAQGNQLVNDLSFHFEEGITTALVGPSGGGKSTVLKLAAGLFPPDDGEVLFRGRDIARMGRQENLLFRREAAVVFQDSALWANQSLFQILELPLRVHFPTMSKTDREKRVESVAVEVGYKKRLDVRPSQLSMGEQKLLAFARAMMCRPRLLFLDEWTESLDQNAADRLVGMVRDLKSRGVSVIFVSHNIPVIRALADIALMIFGGRIAHRLTKEQISTGNDLGLYIEQGMTA
jgi:ABC-type multidrug transport system ATPase subunit